MWRMLWVVRGAVAAGLAALALLGPAALEHGPVLCPFRRLLGIECLGCGLSRAIASLLRGDPAGAAGYNVLGFVALPLLLLFAVRGPGRRVEQWIAKNWDAR